MNDYISILNLYSQKLNIKIKYDYEEKINNDNIIMFKCISNISNNIFISDFFFTKKKAKQNVCQKIYTELNIENILNNLEKKIKYKIHEHDDLEKLYNNDTNEFKIKIKKIENDIIEIKEIILYK